MMSGWFAVVFGTLLAWFTLAGSADGQPVNCTEPAQAVRTIWANFYINAVREINSPSSTFYADIYVNYEWFDPELSSGNSAFLDRASATDPAIEFVNGRDIKPVFIDYLPARTNRDANIRVEARYAGTFFANFRFTRFPFDTQVLPIVFESEKYPCSKLVIRYQFRRPSGEQSRFFLSQEVALNRHVESSLRLNEWDIQELKVTERIRSLPYEESQWSQLRIEMEIGRKSGYYVFKFMLIITLFCGLSLGVLLIDANIINYRLSIPISLLVAVIALNFTAGQVLPRIPYLTFLDIHINTAYLCIILIAFEGIAGKILVLKNRQDIVTMLNRYTLVTLPILFVAVHVIALLTLK